MGLGLYIGTRLAPARLRSTTAGEPEVLHALRDALPLAIGDLLHTHLSEMWRTEDGLAARLHPAEEAVEFRLEPAGLLTASAKTSSAGPGYHAFLVHLLEQLGEQCDLSWVWEDSERGFLDEAGYFGDRDFGRLQSEMAGWLRSLARHITSEDGYAHLALSLPADFQVPGDYFAISSLGYWDRQWFESVSEASEGELYERSAEFFPWWSRDRDARFWLNCGLVKAWVDLSWRPPQDDHELAGCRRTLECLELAQRLDPGLPLPDREIDDLNLLVGEADRPDFRPAEEGVGFHRRPMRRPLTGGWTIVVPGFYYDEMEDDHTTVVYWYANRTVRGSSLSFEPGPSPDAAAPEPDEAHRELEFAEAHLTGVADIEWFEEEDESYWRLQGEVRAPGRICILSICFEDAADREWAVETRKSTFIARE